MKRLFLSLAFTALVLPAGPPAPAPAKAPDAFHYFFGKKDKKDAKDAKDVKKAEPAAVKESPAPEPVSPPRAPEVRAPIPVPAAPAAEAPAAPVPRPEARPEPRPETEKLAKPAPRADAFQYFFGRSTQRASKPEAQKGTPAEKKSVDAFDYLFGKKTKTVPADPEKEHAKPPGI